MKRKPLLGEDYEICPRCGCEMCAGARLCRDCYKKAMKDDDFYLPGHRYETGRAV